MCMPQTIILFSVTSFARVNRTYQSYQWRDEDSSVSLHHVNSFFFFLSEWVLGGWVNVRYEIDALDFIDLGVKFKCISKRSYLIVNPA